MKKYIVIIFLVSISVVYAETDSSKIDFYQKGKTAARENFKPKYSFALGAAMPNPSSYGVLNLLIPVKIDEEFNSILNAKNRKSYKRGYVIETKKLRLKESVTGSCYTIVVVGTLFIIALGNSPILH